MHPECSFFQSLKRLQLRESFSLKDPSQSFRSCYKSHKMMKSVAKMITFSHYLTHSKMALLPRWKNSLIISIIFTILVNFFYFDFRPRQYQLRSSGVFLNYSGVSSAFELFKRQMNKNAGRLLWCLFGHDSKYNSPMFIMTQYFTL